MVYDEEQYCMELDTEASRAVNCPEPVEGKYFVYILLCKDSSFYVGLTEDLANRLKEHATGEAALWTKMRRPVKLIYYETHLSLLSARRREKQLKGWTRLKKLKLIAGLWK